MITMNHLLIVASFASLLLSCSVKNPVNEETTEIRNSTIKPAQPFFTDKNFIEVISPSNGASFAIDSSVFQYTTNLPHMEEIYFSIFIILDTIPTPITFKENFQNNCVAGLTTTAFNWDYNLGAISLPKLRNCDPQSSTMIGTNPAQSSMFTTGKKYYWLLIGFDESLDICHSTSLREFIISRSTP